MTTLPLVQNILEANDRLARENERLFAKHGVLVLNMMGTPGAGKTALLEQTARRLGEGVRWAVIEGDIQGALDADRLEALGVPVVQINTGGACHLDANMIREALEHVDLAALDLLVVENVGNLVCPAEFEIGEALKVMVISTTEGEEKPSKYPLMFRESRLLVLNKIDLAPHLDFDEARLLAAVRDVNPDLPLVRLSCRTEDGLDEWIAWLEGCLKKTGE